MGHNIGQQITSMILLGILPPALTIKSSVGVTDIYIHFAISSQPLKLKLKFRFIAKNIDLQKFFTFSL